MGGWALTCGNCPGGASAPRRTGFLSPRPGLGGPRRPSPPLWGALLRDCAWLPWPPLRRAPCPPGVPSLQRVRAPPLGPLSPLLRSTVSEARVPPCLLSLFSVSHGGFLWSLLLHRDQNSCSVNAQGHLLRVTTARPSVTRGGRLQSQISGLSLIRRDLSASPEPGAGMDGQGTAQGPCPPTWQVAAPHPLKHPRSSFSWRFVCFPGRASWNRRSSRHFHCPPCRGREGSAVLYLLTSFLLNMFNAFLLPFHLFFFWWWWGRS